MSRLYWTEELILDRIQEWAFRHEGRAPTGCEWRKATPGFPSTQTVRERFGTWARAVELAGFDRPNRGPKGPIFWTRARIRLAIRAWTIRHGRRPYWTDWKHAAPEHPAAHTVQRTFGSWPLAVRLALDPLPA